jgi:hypothetical protein
MIRQQIPGVKSQSSLSRSELRILVDFEYCKASKLFFRIRTQAPLKVFCHLHLTLDTEGHQTSHTLFYQLLIERNCPSVLAIESAVKTTAL